jgi:hypothetical protein
MSTTSSTRKRYNTRNNKQPPEEKELNTDLMSAYRTSSQEETSENNTPKNTKKVKTSVPDLMDTDNNFNNQYHPLDSETHENATSSTSRDQNVTIDQTPIGSLQQKLPNEVDQPKDANQNRTSKNKDDEIKHLELNISGDFEQGFVRYKAFIPRDNFSSKLSHKEIEKNIRNALVSEHSFTKLVCMSQSSYDFFVLTFNTKEKQEEYIKKGIKNIFEKLYNYDHTSLNIILD